MTVVGECFDIAILGGVHAYGATMTRWGTSGYMYHTFGPGSGWCAPVPPVLLKKKSALTLSGPMCDGVFAKAAAICGCAGPWNAPRTVSPISCSYGGVGSEFGWTTDNCIGARLRVSARSNALVTIGLDMIGGKSTSGVPGGGDPSTAKFYPAELCTCNLGTALGFDFTFDAGLDWVWPMVGDNEEPDSIVDKGASATLSLILATDPGFGPGDDAEGAVGLGDAGSIMVTGLCTGLDREVVEGVLCCRATITGTLPTFVAVG